MNLLSMVSTPKASISVMVSRTATAGPQNNLWETRARVKSVAHPNNHSSRRHDKERRILWLPAAVTAESA